MPIGVTTLAQFNGADGLGDDKAEQAKMLVGVGSIALLMLGLVIAGGTARALVANKRSGRGVGMPKLRKFKGRFNYVVGTAGGEYEVGSKLYRFKSKSGTTESISKAQRFPSYMAAKKSAQAMTLAVERDAWSSGLGEGDEYVVKEVPSRKSKPKPKPKKTAKRATARKTTRRKASAKKKPTKRNTIRRKPSKGKSKSKKRSGRSKR